MGLGPDELAIAVFSYSRAHQLGDILRSLELQGALEHTHVWIDGHQGSPGRKAVVEQTKAVAKSFRGPNVYAHNGNLGFRKMLLTALRWHCENHAYLAVLEDDCFPTNRFLTDIRAGLHRVDADEGLFSCYGAHFLSDFEPGPSSRFQGWGWAAPTAKLAPVLDALIETYSMTEFQYRDWVDQALTADMLEKLDVTPGRNPTDTLREFFAWDETLALLTAQRGLSHLPTDSFCVRNCGMGEDSTHFGLSDIFRAPPFNMIGPSEVWEYY